MAKGTVKWFSAEKGFGFIAPTMAEKIFSCTILQSITQAAMQRSMMARK